MARTLLRSVLPVLMVAAACNRAGDSAGDGAASAGRTDTARQATAAPAARDTAQVRQAVLRLEAELFQSYVRGDTALSARILAEDYLGFSGDGMRETRAQALGNLHRDTTATAATVDSIHVDSTTVRVYGDAVVAQTSGSFQAHDRRQSGSVGFRNTDVFVWRDGRWQIVASHLSKVAAPQGRSHTP